MKIKLSSAISGSGISHQLLPTATFTLYVPPFAVNSEFKIPKLSAFSISNYEVWVASPFCKVWTAQHHTSFLLKGQELTPGSSFNISQSPLQHSSYSTSHWPNSHCGKSSLWIYRYTHGFCMLRNRRLLRHLDKGETRSIWIPRSWLSLASGFTLPIICIQHLLYLWYVFNIYFTYNMY